jgi:aspartate/glutamate racemase
VDKIVIERRLRLHILNLCLAVAGEKEGDISIGKELLIHEVEKIAADARADRENLHQRVKELLSENAKLLERLGPRGLEVVIIGNTGHYVSSAVKAEIDRLRQVGGNPNRIPPCQTQMPSD